MNPIKLYFRLLNQNHYVRLITAVVLAGVGSVLGSGGLLEIKTIRYFFDILSIIGFVTIGIYALLLTIIGFYNVLGGGYQVGSYNKWRDGDFEEWKKKNNIDNNWFDKFIDRLSKPIFKVKN